MRPHVLPPRTISTPPEGLLRGYVPWLEVAARVEIWIPDWQHRDTSWLHWALPLVPGELDAPHAYRFDPGRRAGRLGEPDPPLRDMDPPGGDAELVGAALSVVTGWQPLLHRHRSLGLVSALDEPRDGFRRRCLGLLRPGVQRAIRDGFADPAILGRVAEEIDSMAVTPPLLRMAGVTVRKAWYPGHVPPLPVEGELMVSGAVRGAR